MTITDTTTRPDTREMLVVHRVYRREITLLARMVRAVPAGNTGRARLIAGHFADYQLGLHVLPLITEYLTVAEWSQLGERFARDTPQDKLLFFLGLILEDASPRERKLMLGTCPGRPGCGTRSGSAHTSGRSAGSARRSPLIRPGAPAATAGRREPVAGCCPSKA